jgi:hypothetical protein
VRKGRRAIVRRATTDDPGSMVTESGFLNDLHTGTPREVDIVIAGEAGGHAAVVAIECRAHSRRQVVAWIEEMHAKHSRLPTSVLVLGSRTAFSREACRIADLYKIRRWVLDTVDPDAPSRLFPDVQSLWSKGWEFAVDRAVIYVGGDGSLPAEHFRAAPDQALFLADGTHAGTAADLASVLLQSSVVANKMAAEANPEHSFLELTWGPPVVLGGVPLHVQKLEPVVLRPIEKFRLVAKCRVSVEQVPLRHGELNGIRVAWGTGSLVGKPTLIVATARENQLPTITVTFRPEPGSQKQRAPKPRRKKEKNLDDPGGQT